MTEKIHSGCGGIIMPVTLASYPPIYVERCTKCGAELSRSRGEIHREYVDIPGPRRDTNE